MSRRLPSTLADYVVVGINPALIMILIASVVFFLVDVFFPCGCGCAQDLFCNLRLKYVFAMFIMGTVAVGRISMEEGAGYAATFAAPLALAAFVVINAFVKMEGTFTALSPLINLGLMALIWWLSYQLTWDCTVLDERADTSDQGLLQAFGADETLPEEVPPEPPLVAEKPLMQSILENPLPWLQQMWERSKQPHAHGLWIIYFALGALPIFGFGGWFSHSRQTAFAMLVLYMATSLALLLSTSFLGLRRYLRRRNVEMPVEMTSVWLAVGGIMIVGVLLACVILPRPGAEIAISRIPFPTFSSPWQRPSQFGLGSDGQQPQPNNSGSSSWFKKLTKENLDPEEQAQQQNANSSASGENKSGSGGQQGSAESGKSASGEKSADKNSSEKGDSGKQQSPANKQANDAKQDQANKDKQAGQNQSGGQQSVLKKNNPPTQSTGSKNGPPQSPPQKSNPAKAPEPTSQTPSSFSMSGILGMIFGLLGVLLKLAFYAILAGVIAYYVYMYREEIKAAWQKLLAELKALWERWFGRQHSAANEVILAEFAPTIHPFAAYADPFATGQATRMKPVELVRYTFDALQAWGLEHDCPRQENETPHEYVERLGVFAPQIANESLRLADYYGLAAYAGGKLPAQSVEAVRALWQKLADSAVLV